MAAQPAKWHAMWSA